MSEPTLSLSIGRRTVANETPTAQIIPAKRTFALDLDPWSINGGGAHSSAANATDRVGHRTHRRRSPRPTNPVPPVMAMRSHADHRQNHAAGIAKPTTLSAPWVAAIAPIERNGTAA